MIKNLIIYIYKIQKIHYIRYVFHCFILDSMLVIITNSRHVRPTFITFIDHNGKCHQIELIKEIDKKNKNTSYINILLMTNAIHEEEVGINGAIYFYYSLSNSMLIFYWYSYSLLDVPHTVIFVYKNREQINIKTNVVRFQFTIAKNGATYTIANFIIFIASFILYPFDNKVMVEYKRG